jgi:hypothetical protein
MDSIRQVVIHLRSTLRPIGPSLIGTVGVLRRDSRLILALLAASILTLTLVWEAANYWVDHSPWRNDLPRVSQQLDTFCKAASDSPDLLPLCLAPLIQQHRQLSFYISIGAAAKFSAAALVTVILYLWVSARAASRLAAPPGLLAPAMVRRETVYVGLAAIAILLGPALLFYLLEIAGGLLFGLGVTGPYHSTPAQIILRDCLSATWFLIAAPFVLPVVPIAFGSDGTTVFTRAARLGWDRYLQFMVLAALTTGPFVGVAVLANRSLRGPVVTFLYSDRHLGDFGRVAFDALLTSFALAAVIAAAATFVVAVGPRLPNTR